MKSILDEMQIETDRVGTLLEIDEKKLKFENSTQNGYHLRVTRTVSRLLKNALIVKGRDCVT
jgi:hypothetical protein